MAFGRSGSREGPGSSGRLCIWAAELGSQSPSLCDMRGGALKGESRCFREALAAEKMVLRVRDLGSLQAAQSGDLQASSAGWGRVGEAEGAAQVSEFYSADVLL